MPTTTGDEGEYSEGICWINEDERVKHKSFVAHTLEFLQQEKLYQFSYNDGVLHNFLYVHLAAKTTYSCTVF